MTTPSETFTIRRITPETCTRAFVDALNRRFREQGDEDDYEMVERPWILEAARTFVQSSACILLVAEGTPPGRESPAIVGFLFGHLLLMPHSHPQILLYDIGTHSDFRKRGVGAALIEALKAAGRDMGAGEMWVLTDRPNIAAMTMYARAGGEIADEEIVMFDFDL